MYKIVPASLLTLMFLSACNKEVPKPITREEIQHRIDSATKVRIEDVDERARIELEHRIKIEVKIKADSILQLLLQQTGPDSAKHIDSILTTIK